MTPEQVQERSAMFDAAFVEAERRWGPTAFVECRNGVYSVGCRTIYNTELRWSGCSFPAAFYEAERNPASPILFRSCQEGSH